MFEQRSFSYISFPVVSSSLTIYLYISFTQLYQMIQNKHQNPTVPTIDIVSIDCKHGSLPPPNCQMREVRLNGLIYCADVYKPDKTRAKQIANRKLEEQQKRLQREKNIQVRKEIEQKGLDEFINEAEKQLIHETREKMKKVMELKHDNIVRVMGYYVQDNNHYILKERVKNVIKNQDLDNEMKTRVWASLTPARIYLHEQNLTYDDWRLQNIIVYKTDQNEVMVKLADCQSRKVFCQIYDIQFFKSADIYTMGDLKNKPRAKWTLEERKKNDCVSLVNILFHIENKDFAQSDAKKRIQIKQQVVKNSKDDQLKKDLLAVHQNPIKVDEYGIKKISALFAPTPNFDGETLPNLGDIIERVPYSKPTFKAQKYSSNTNFAVKLKDVTFQKTEEFNFKNIFFSEQAFRGFVQKNKTDGGQKNEKNVKKIVFQMCGITGRHFRGLEGNFFSQLKELDLSDNAVGSGLPKLLKLFPTVTILKLANCQFSRKDVARFLEIPNNLQKLHISNSDFGSDPFEPLKESFYSAKMPNLRSLCLRKTNLCDSEFFGLMRCPNIPNLLDLDVSANLIRDGLRLAIEASMKDLEQKKGRFKIYKKLTKINLENNQIESGDGLKLIWKYERLENIFVFGNPLANQNKNYLLCFSSKLEGSKLKPEQWEEEVKKIKEPDEMLKQKRKLSPEKSQLPEIKQSWEFKKKSLLVPDKSSDQAQPNQPIGLLLNQRY